ncbi:rhodanese-like domain-containing protein [Flavobacterium sp. MFBS3-15]|uniref:rhodanese-like domain-containing protein n=1 Tax=Flavobacterium sp. MFBS3-15 TaxID=2989816 RepID=UPI002235B8B2|nr:rhodanese-like domain-containing protein [Flavobacterium sp. MFBS3-15]MCW4468864.1 rhodanese-like domain-containing protein [Flavobacterium sp. MFBS3-15]
MKKIVFLFIATFTLLSCEAQQKKGVELVPPVEFEKQMAEHKGQLIDVRTPKEFAEGHLEGAENIHLYDRDFIQRVDKLDKKETVYVYCKAGGRSSEAVSILKTKGFEHIVELQGGTDAWAEDGKPFTE